MGINPEFFRKKTFNLSNISQSLYYDIQLTMKYIDKMPELKHVIISTSYFSLGMNLNDGIESWRAYYYSQYWDINAPDLDKFNIKNYSKIFLYTTDSSLVFLRNGFKTNLTEGLMQNGYYSVDTSGHKKFLTDDFGHYRADFHNRFFKFNRVAENVKGLELFLSELKKRNIKFVIISIPVNNYYKKYVDSTLLMKNNDLLTNICMKHQCDYLDFFDDKRFSQDDFYDNDHLNFIGAEKFSRILNDEMMRLK